MRAYYFGDLRSRTDPLGETERFRAFRAALEQAAARDEPTRRSKRRTARANSRGSHTRKHD